MKWLPVRQLVLLVVFLIAMGIPSANANKKELPQVPVSVTAQTSSDLVALFSDSIDLISYDPRTEISERIIGLSEFPNELIETQAQIIYDHELVQDVVRITPGYEFISAVKNFDGDIVYAEATCVSNSCPVKFRLYYASASADGRIFLLDEAMLPSGLFPQLVGWSGNDLFFDTYDHLRDRPFQGIWKYDLSSRDLVATALIEGAYNSRIWVAPDGARFLTTSQTTPQNINSFEDQYRTERVIIYDPKLDKITIVADRPTSGEYYIAGWVSRQKLEYASINPTPRSVSSVPEATSGFQRPMANDHYGFHWLAWTGSVFHPADDYNGPGTGNADCGTDIKAVANGTVRYYNSGGWGTLVIEHRWKDTTVYSQYGHVASSLVSVGSNVSKGQHIAEMGSVGADTCHLHWEIRESDHPNPTNGSYYTTSVLNNQGNVENYYEDPEWWVDNHGAYSIGDTVKLYRKPNHQGEELSFGIGFTNEPEGEIYSMKVPSGWSVWTYREENKGGQKRCWNGDVTNFQDHDDWQNKIQSIDVKNFNDCPPDPPSCPQSGGVILYWNNNYNCNNDDGDKGYRQRTGTGWENISGAFNNRASSVKVPAGWSVRLYAEGDRGQPSICFTGEVSDFGPLGNFPGSSTGINDQVSSFEVFNNATCGGTLTPGIPVLASPSNGATIVEGDSITLSWNSASNASEYYGDISGGPLPLSFDWQSGTSKNIGAQWPGYEYNWKVKSRNGSGESSYSSVWKFTVIPKAPINVAATPLSCTWVKVTWTDNSASEDGYKVYRNGQEIGTVSIGGTSVTDQGAEGGKSYTYTVKAYRNGFFSNAGSASATTPDCPVQPPQSPVIIAPSYGKVFVEGEAVTLSWENLATATGYYGEVTGGPSPIIFGWQPDTSEALGAQPPGYEYFWRVKARNNGGESGYTDKWLFTVVPKAPTNTSASALSCNSVKVTWNDNSNSEDGYKIYRNGAEVGSVGAGSTNYTDGVQAKNTYTYTVKAHRNGFFSNAGSASVTTPDCPVQPPAPPVLVSPLNWETFVEGEDIILTWNGVANATGYFGSISGGPAPMTFGWQTNTSKNIGAQWPGYEYLWEVKAKNGSVEGNYSSNRVFRVIPKAPSNLSASIQSCNSVKLSWKDNSTSEDGYKIYRDGTEVGSVGAGGNSYTDQGLQGQTNYNYIVRSHRNGLNSKPSDTASTTTPSCNNDTTPPQVTWVEPVGNEGTYEVSGETVTLKVNATDNVGVDFVVFWRWDHPTQQNIELGMDSQSPYTALVDTSEFTNDWNQISAQAIDKAGNASDIFSIWLYYEPNGGNLGAPYLNVIDNPDGDGNYTIDWLPISSATAYNLQERYNSGSWSQVYDGPNTSVNRSNRSDGEWCYRARAYNNSVESDWSAVECTTVSTVVNPPQVPTLYSIGSSGQQGSYWVSWSSVNGATTYELQERYSSGTFKQIYSGPDTSQYVFGQSEGTWCYRVRAKNGTGVSNWSQIQCTTVVLNNGAYKSLIPLIID